MATTTRTRKLDIQIAAEAPGVGKVFDKAAGAGDKFADKLKKAGEKAGTGLTVGVEAGTSKLADKLRKAGEKAGRGFEGGIDRGTSKLDDRFQRVGDAADTADTRAMGFRDSMTGVEDTSIGLSKIMKGDLFDGFLTLGMGFGDLASGIANFGAQFARQIGAFLRGSATMVASMATTVASTVAGWITMGIAATINAAKMAAAWLISLGPIALVVLAIGGIIGILAALGFGFDDFKNIAGAAWDFVLGAAQAVWGWLQTNWPLVLAILTGPIGLAVLAITKHWDTIKSGFTAVKDWISDRIGDIVGFFTGLPGRITSAASGMWDGITGAFKGAINSIIRLWNGIKFPSLTIGGQDPLGSFGPSLPEVTIGGWNLPNIPLLAHGAIVTRPTLAMVGEGRHDEAVIPLDGRHGTGDTFIITNNFDFRGSTITNERDFEDKVVGVVNKAIATGTVNDRGRRL